MMPILVFMSLSGVTDVNLHVSLLCTIFRGSNSRQKPSYRHPRARVPMLSMVEYSCTVQLFRTAVLCHVINRSVTSSDTSS